MDLVTFAERTLSMLDQGRTNSTYKYAVLLGLIDLCMELTSKGGQPPTTVTTLQLADRVIHYYWPQARPYAPEGGEARVLQQDANCQAKILQLITRFQLRAGKEGETSVHRLRHQDPSGWARLRKGVEWCLVQMPLPRLQRIGNEADPFIYTISWDKELKRSEWSDEETFDNRIHLLPGVGDYLVRLSGMLRPLVQHKWTEKIASIKNNAIEDAGLSKFLFSSGRISLKPVTDHLYSLQEGRCFYCKRPFDGQCEVDHFIPWARHPDNGIENLVLADHRCNASKSDHLAAAQHVDQWVRRIVDRSSELTSIADQESWESHPQRTTGVARSLFGGLSAENRLWVQGTSFRPADPTELGRILKCLP